MEPSKKPGRFVNPVVVGELPSRRSRHRPSDPEFERILLTHVDWLNSEKGRGDRPSFSGLDLSGRKFIDCDLSQADLSDCCLDRTIFHKCLLVGANLSNSLARNAVFFGSNLSSAFAPNSDFSGSNFVSYEEGSLRYSGHSNLESARLSATNFTGANLGGVSLAHADLQRATFCGAFLSEGDLKHALALGADFTKAHLTFARLDFTDFRMANLHEAKIRHANLQRADLRDVKGRYFLDDNFVRHTKFSPGASDPYSRLRERYTGARLVVILVLTLLAFSPYLMKAVAWSVVSRTQGALNEMTENRSANSTFVLRSAARKVRVFAIVLDIDESFPSTAFFSFVLLALYNGVRALVTIKTSSLRDAEERSSHVPGKCAYLTLYRVDRYFLSWFFYVALAISCVSVVKFLYSPILMPQ